VGRIDKHMEISVIILSWNDLQHLMICLESLKRNAVKRTMEIIVVDNASIDGSPDAVANRYPDVILIRNKENLGFPKGNNMGIKASKGKYICLVNSDIEFVNSGTMDAIADYLDEHPDIGMIGPKILNADLTHQSSCRRFPTFWNNICEALGLATAFKQSKFLGGEHMLYFKGDRILDVDVLVGCFWMVRREALSEFGLLDEDFFMYAEDIDWCLRCWKAGWRVVFFSGARAIHYRGSSSKNDPVRCAIDQQHSVLHYWKKHHGIVSRTIIKLLIFNYLLLRLGPALIRHVFQLQHREETRVYLQILRSRFSALFLMRSRSDAQDARIASSPRSRVLS
jgi:GT2 family glycosyltransferase